MSFDIRPIGGIGAIRPGTAEQREDADRARQRPKPEAGDTVNISAEARASAAGNPPVDAERVAEIRRALKSGDYPVTPAKIADAMIAAKLMLSVGE